MCPELTVIEPRNHCGCDSDGDSWGDRGHGGNGISDGNFDTFNYMGDHTSGDDGVMFVGAVKENSSSDSTASATVSSSVKITASTVQASNVKFY